MVYLLKLFDTYVKKSVEVQKSCRSLKIEVEKVEAINLESMAGSVIQDTGTLEF